MVATDPIVPDPHGFSVRPPRPLCVGLATVVVVVAAVGLRIGTPIYRQHIGIREIDRIGGWVWTRHFEPAWMRGQIPDELAVAVEDVIEVSLNGTALTDGDIEKLEPSLQYLRNVEVLDLSNNTEVTDDGLRNLEVLFPRLRKLYLHGTIVSKYRIADATRQIPGLEVNANGVVYAGGSEK